MLIHPYPQPRPRPLKKVGVLLLLGGILSGGDDYGGADGDGRDLCIRIDNLVADWEGQPQDLEQKNGPNNRSVSATTSTRPKSVV